MTEVVPRRNNRSGFLLFERKALAQLVDQGRIHSEAIGLLVLLERHG